MLKHKRMRERGKHRLSRLFQELGVGNRVAVVRNLSSPGSFPRRIQGKTGTIIEKRGNALMVLLRDGKKEKKFIITKEHLQKLK